MITRKILEVNLKNRSLITAGIRDVYVKPAQKLRAAMGIIVPYWCLSYLSNLSIKCGAHSQVFTKFLTTFLHNHTYTSAFLTQ